MSKEKHLCQYYQYDFIDKMLVTDAKYVGKYDFPMLRQNNPDLSDIVCWKPFNYLLGLKNPEVVGIHCFVDDYQFVRLRKNTSKYEEKIAKLPCFICTDFSIFRDVNTDINVEQVRKNRTMAYVMQKINHNTIPTAGFGGEDTWEWCFDGIPKHSTVAVTTNGIWNDAEARRLFAGGIHTLIVKIEPVQLVVCGLCPEWISTRYKDVHVISIPNYNQMRRNA